MSWGYIGKFAYKPRTFFLLRSDIAFQVLKSEMEKVVGKEVSIKPGKLVVDGNYHMRLKKWLIGLGF